MRKGRFIQIDRKENIYQNWYLTFPHQDGPEYNHSNTVLDGEFVIDVDPTSGAVSSLSRLRSKFAKLIFDELIVLKAYSSIIGV